MVAFMNTLSSVLFATLLSVVLFATQGGALTCSGFMTCWGADLRSLSLFACFRLCLFWILVVDHAVLSQRKRTNGHTHGSHQRPCSQFQQEPD